MPFVHCAILCLRHQRVAFSIVILVVVGFAASSSITLAGDETAAATAVHVQRRVLLPMVGRTDGTSDTGAVYEAIPVDQPSPDGRPAGAPARIGLLMDHACDHAAVREVPDPYYGAATGFEHVLDLVEDACRGLVAELAATLPPEPPAQRRA